MNQIKLSSMYMTFVEEKKDKTKIVFVSYTISVWHLKFLCDIVEVIFHKKDLNTTSSSLQTTPGCQIMPFNRA